MAADDGLGELLMELEEKAGEGGTLFEGASVFRFAVGVEAAFVADAD